MWGAIEAGGTKFVCARGTGPDDLELAQIPTTTPVETLAGAVAFFRKQPVAAIGIGSFGPVDLRRDSPAWGHITSTPKAGWRDYDLAGAVRNALGVPVAFDTDVNAAALGEARWGAGRGLTDFLYITVGTGIGGGALVHGSVIHGHSHPEMGHIRVPRDRARDPFGGCCPYHGDCLEGLASGPALEARWGCPPEMLPAEHAAWALEAHYLALAIQTWMCVLSPQRIVLGGGVMQRQRLFGMIREELAELLGGYVPACDIVAPQLGPRAGVLGALALAEQCL